jgi:hypothetical protein
MLKYASVVVKFLSSCINFILKRKNLLSSEPKVEQEVKMMLPG